MPDQKDRLSGSTENRDDLELALAVAAFYGELSKAFPKGLPEDRNALRAYIEMHRGQWMAKSDGQD